MAEVSQEDLSRAVRFSSNRTDITAVLPINGKIAFVTDGANTAKTAGIAIALMGTSIHNHVFMTLDTVLRAFLKDRQIEGVAVSLDDKGRATLDIPNMEVAEKVHALLTETKLSPQIRLPAEAAPVAPSAPAVLPTAPVTPPPPSIPKKAPQSIPVGQLPLMRKGPPPATGVPFKRPEQAK